MSNVTSNQKRLCDLTINEAISYAESLAKELGYSLKIVYGARVELDEVVIYKEVYSSFYVLKSKEGEIVTKSNVFKKWEQYCEAIKDAPSELRDMLPEVTLEAYTQTAFTCLIAELLLIKQGEQPNFS